MLQIIKNCIKHVPFVNFIVTMTNITIYQFLSTSDPLNEADKSPVDNTVQIETPSKLARLEIIHRTRVPN